MSGKTVPIRMRPEERTELLLLGVNHTTAPIDVRERLAIPAGRLADATKMLAEWPGIREAMILSTCNRVELLTVQDGLSADGEKGPEGTVPTLGMLRFLNEYLRVQVTDIQPHVYEFREGEAVRHLFRVASSLDSMVVGESQILGQVKQSWAIGRDVGAVKSTLDPLLQRAFSVAKRVRTETQIGKSTVSIASVAAELARKIFGSLAGKTVLLVGAGKMSDLTARHLIQQGAKTLLVSNRTEARAEAIADLLRTPSITTGVIPLAQLYEQLHRADIVITSTGAGQVFTPENARPVLQRRKNRPVFFIDIAVPRDVAPAVNDLEGCFVYDIDDLQQVAMQNKAVRNYEAEAAETIVSSEVARYREQMLRAPSREAIKQLMLDAEAVRMQEMARIVQQLLHEPLSEAQAAAVDRLTKSLTGKLLHPQIAALRGDSDDAE